MSLLLTLYIFHTFLSFSIADFKQVTLFQDNSEIILFLAKITDHIFQKKPIFHCR